MIAASIPHLPALSFDLPFEGKLDTKNRWVILANALPWDKLESAYNRALCADNGRPALSSRLVLGALLAKHILKISDEEVILHIQENIYLQYFVGLAMFQTSPIFDASLFVTIRKRLGKEGVTEVETAIVKAMYNSRQVAKTDKQVVEVVQEPAPKDEINNEIALDEPKDKDTDASETPTETTDTNQELITEETSDKEATDPQKDLEHRGHLKVDTTVSPQKIKYPKDLDLLNKAREKTENLIDLLCIQLGLPRATCRSYRRIARKNYLKVAKKKKKSKKELRAAIRKQLSYLKRNLLTIKTLITQLNTKEPDAALKGWCKSDIEQYATIQTLYAQQKAMYDTKTNRCDNRIVSISQPYVRPIVRKKAHVNTEFGAKIAIATVDGISTIDNLSWEAYNENSDLIKHIERYKQLYGCYPETINCDKIYHTRANYHLAKAYGIRLIGLKLGRPKKIDQTPKAKRAAQAERNQRNVVEGKIGQAKNRYGLDKIAAKDEETSYVWIKCCLIATNLMRWLKDLSLSLIEKFSYFDKLWLFIMHEFITTKNQYKNHRKARLFQ